MRTVLVHGPAYLDRVVRVDRPLVPGEVIDGSWDGVMDRVEGASQVEDSDEYIVFLSGLEEGKRPLGAIRLLGRLGNAPPLTAHYVDVLNDRDDLGGMGAGYAKALGGRLISALGPIGDPVGDRVAGMLAAQGIVHEPVRVEGRPSDWSLIVSSGAHGDKLAVGFRGCHSAVAHLAVDASPPPVDLLVVTSWPNRLVAEALAHPAKARMVAPAMRNALDRAPTLASLAGRFDLLTLNRREWAAMPDREGLRERTPIVMVTDGPRGCEISFRSAGNALESRAFPSFPRMNAPRDTNRAGEAFASSFVAALLDGGWTPGPADPDLIREAANRGSASAALVLDREDFGFPTAREVDLALMRGMV